MQDLEEKLSIFIAKYNYDPMLFSPNENPEMELAFQAGDYLYVYGDIDEVRGNIMLHKCAKIHARKRATLSMP